MSRLWVLLLALILVAVVIAFFYERDRKVRVETVFLQSQLNNKTLPYNVILPRGYNRPAPWRKSYPVLYLLHGHGGDYSAWIANTGLTSYLANFDLIVVTPEGQNGWYTDSATVSSEKNETYLLKELIPDVESRFRVIRERSGRAIAGYSMGGYGALKFGLKYPEIFAVAASMSGAFDAPLRIAEPSIMQTFGSPDNQVRDLNNLSKLAKRASPSALPYIYFECGSEDPWLLTNRELDGVFKSSGIQHNYIETSGGHDWGHWDRQVPAVLRLAVKKLSPPR